MVAMSLVRRRQLILRGMEDPYAHKLPSVSRNTSTPAGAGVSPCHTMTSRCTDRLLRVAALGHGSYDSGESQSIRLDLYPQLSENKIVMALEQASAQQDLNKSLLRIAYIMQQSKTSRYIDGDGH